MFDTTPPTAGAFGQDGFQSLGWAEFAVQGVQDDYLDCMAFDGVAAYGDSIRVAKMPDLRRSLYHGLTLDHGGDIGSISYSYTGPQARTLTKSGETQDQIVIPAYDTPGAGANYTGTIILAMPKLTILPVVDNDPIVCQWCEISNRAWASLPEEESPAP